MPWVYCTANLEGFLGLQRQFHAAALNATHMSERTPAVDPFYYFPTEHHRPTSLVCVIGLGLVDSQCADDFPSRKGTEAMGTRS